MLNLYYYYYYYYYSLSLSLTRANTHMQSHLRDENDTMVNNIVLLGKHRHYAHFMILT